MQQKSVIVAAVVLVLIVLSLTGLAYCWQEGLSDAGALLGFMFFLIVFMGAVVGGVVYGAIQGFRKADEYIRDVTSASIEAARESAEETVENIPGTIMDGIEKSFKKTRDRFMGRGDESSTSRRRRPREIESGASDSPSVDNASGKTKPTEEAEDYRRVMDRAIDKLRNARKKPE